MDEENAAPEALSHLIDRLQQRLGMSAVRRLSPRESHVPERAVSPSPLVGEGRGGEACALRWAADAPSALRPLLLLPRPEPAEVVALIPEGPPRQFRWRGVLHQVTEAEGPERIAPEWWRRLNGVERDYYVVEDREGRHFWLYRAGLYGRGEAAPQWFVHGMFG